MPQIDDLILTAKKAKANALLAESQSTLGPQELAPLGMEMFTSEGAGPMTPEIAAQREELVSALKASAPALGATIATLPFGGVGALPIIGGGAARGMALPVLRAMMKLGTSPGNLALGAGRAGVGGGAGTLAVGGTPGEAFESAKTQAIIDPLARLTLGLAKVVARPAGSKLAEQSRRLIDFARTAGGETGEGLLLQPGVVTGNPIIKVVENFTKAFLGSRALSQERLKFITEHISSDPVVVNAFFKKVIGSMTPAQIGAANIKAEVAINRVARTAKSQVVRLAPGKNTPGEAAEILFRDAKAVAEVQAKTTAGEFKALLESHTQNMIQRASKPAGDTGAVIIDGNILANEIKTNRAALDRFYPKEMIDRLENFALYAKAHANAPIEAAENLILSTKQFGATGVMGGATAALDPTGITSAAVVLSSLFASQIFNPRSILGRWLTTGLIPKTGAGAGEAVANFAVRDEATARGADDVLTDLAKRGLGTAGEMGARLNGLFGP